MIPNVLAVSLLLLAQSVLAESITVGQTYPIAERDALEEIESRTKQVDWAKELAPENISWSAKDGHRVRRAPTDRIRHFVPWHTIEFDVRDQFGQVIYPKGFQFNVLEHITLPYRVVVIDPSDVTWVKPLLRDSDMVILTNGDFEEASELLERPTFMLDEKTKQRLGIEAVPSIVRQSGNSFVVEEYFVEVES